MYIIMKKKKPGFTLIEMIIVLALTVIILGIASSMFITGNKVFSESDVKTTLQMEGQAIQEKISDIGMQATKIKSLNVQNNQIKSITISSLDKNGQPYDFEIEKVDSGKVYKNGSKIYELRIDHKLISSNVQNMIIDNNILTADNNSLKDINSIKFTILLRKEKAYSDIEYPIDFRVTFRNKDN